MGIAIKMLRGIFENEKIRMHNRVVYFKARIIIKSIFVLTSLGSCVNLKIKRINNFWQSKIFSIQTNKILKVSSQYMKFMMKWLYLIFILYNKKEKDFWKGALSSSDVSKRF
jgi:hypothetical protein